MFIGNFSYTGVARLKPGVTLEQANADVARLLPVLPEQFPLPPGFTRKMFDDLKLAPNVCPFVQDAVGDVGQVLWIAARHGRDGAAHRVRERRQPLPGPRGGPAPGVGRPDGARRQPRANRARAARRRASRSALRGRRSSAIAVAQRRRWRSSPGSRPTACRASTRSRSTASSCCSRWGSALVAALLFGVCRSSVSASRASLPSRRAGARPARARRGTATRNTLVVAEIALALVLLVVSGLMIRSFQALRSVDPGFRDPEQVQTFRLAVPEAARPPMPIRRFARTSRLPSTWPECRVSRRWACRPPSRWTATTATIPSSSRA